MSSPTPPEPVTVWSRFPLDPRASGDLRAGDSDRETARDIISEAYAHGQLSHEEYSQRLSAVLHAHHLGQLVPVLNDIQVQRSPGMVPRPAAPVPGAPGILGKLALPPSGVTRTALFVVGVTNLIWVWTCLSSGTLYYYWPMWPALGMVIMVLSTMVFGDPAKQQKANEQKQQPPRELS
ncbi:MAG TPA: DUF1707 domain-containing protein [Propionibacterium sp.]|nr:DUF1707 domain-containing protein [Propionibacterium sp.]